MKPPPDASTTKPATAPPTKAENEGPSYVHKTRGTSSAVILMNWELIGIGLLAALAIVFILKRRGGG